MECHGCDRVSIADWLVPMLRSLLLACVCLTPVACVGVQRDRLPQEARLRNIGAPADIAGVYNNEGASQSGEWHPLLSDLLFPGVVFSETPGQVRLGSEQQSVLTCEALLRGKVLAVRHLQQERDFYLADGGVQFDRKAIEPVLSAAGAGVGKTSSILRLTEQGDVVLTDKSGGVGLMLFVVPMVVSNAREALFKRIEARQPPAPVEPEQR